MCVGGRGAEKGLWEAETDLWEPVYGWWTTVLSAAQSRCHHSLTVWSGVLSPQHSKMEETTEREGGAGEALRGGGEEASLAAAGGAAGAGAAAAGGVQRHDGESAGAAQAAAGAGQVPASAPGQFQPVPHTYLLPIPLILVNSYETNGWTRVCYTQR